MSIRAWIAGAMAACLLCGCAGWNQVRHVTPAEYLSSRSPKVVRVALPETSLVLYSPSAQGDSLAGHLERDNPAAKVAVPAAEVRKMEVRGLSNTPAAIFMGACVGLAVASVVLSAKNHTSVR